MPPDQRGEPTIDELRARIDELDAQLVQLLNERAWLALAIGRHKRSGSLPVRASAREERILAQISRQNAGPLDTAELLRIFSAIIEACRAMQTTRQGSDRSH